MANETSDYDAEILLGNHTYAYDLWDPFEYDNVHKNWIYYSASIACPIVIFVGVFTNILAFVVLVRSRLWLKHEGYVYLAANYWVNVGVLLFCTSTFWIATVYGLGDYYPANTSNFICKVWHFLMSIFFASGWLSVALVFNVYLREYLIHRRRDRLAMYAAKYCTLFASKIIVGAIFSVLFVFGVPYLIFFNIHQGGSCLPSDDIALALGIGIPLLVESIIMWIVPFVFFLPIVLLLTLCKKREGNIVGFSEIEERSLCHDQMRVVAVVLSSMTLFSHCTIAPFYRVIPLVALSINLSICLQPILCFVILKELRDGFRSQLRNIRCCRRPVQSLDREEEVVQLSVIQEDRPNPTES